ncbi:MAG: molybdopterin-synthase adenylyltransferase MoeB [Rhodobiaceae bacterium]|nr:molybdopterin-synthase adenylyltransferase MoeB [Rhodobiaceae bacterium]
MALSDDELERYARHIVLPGVGGPGQQKFKAARVLVVGAGGLGSPVLQYLAAAGIGTLGIVDDDTVSLSNLQRQILHRTPDVGRPKVDSAADAIAALNPHVTVEKHPVRITADNAAKLIAAYDLVVDGCDNFDTRFAVADACAAAKKPLVTGAVGAFDGTVSVFKPYETRPDGRPMPSYRDLVPTAPSDDQAPACETAGILGALPGVIGSMMALEALKEIAGTGDSLAGRLFMYDARDARVQILKL